MNAFLTSSENIVINELFFWLKEERFNRNFDEYMEIGLSTVFQAEIDATVW